MAWLGGPITSTIQTSWATVTSFVPCSYAVNLCTLSVENNENARAVQIGHYLAQPIDSIIQATAMPIITLIDHFRDIPNRSALGIIAKIICTPVSLPLKIVCSLFLSLGYLFNGITQIVIPYTMINGIIKGKDAAYGFFYELSEIKSEFLKNMYSLKPIEILSEKYSDDTNPICKQKNQLLLEIDEDFRSREYERIQCSKACLDNYEKHKKAKETNEIDKEQVISCLASFDLNTDGTESREFQDLQKKAKIYQEQEEVIQLFHKKKAAADAKWKEIDKISSQSILVINKALPSILYFEEN